MEARANPARRESARRAAVLAATGVMLVTGILAAPAQADHGWDTYRFENKRPAKKGNNAHGIKIFFDKQLSHVEGHSWKNAKCVLKNNDTVVECTGGEVLTEGDSFELAVAPPPPETQANVVAWSWRDKQRDTIGGTPYEGCINRNGCRDIGDEPPAPPFGQPG